MVCDVVFGVVFGGSGRANKMDPDWCIMRPGQREITPADAQGNSEIDPANPGKHTRKANQRTPKNTVMSKDAAPKVHLARIELATFSV